MAGKIYFRPFIPFLISMMIGIALGSWFPGHKVWACLAVFLSASLILYLIKQGKTAFISPLLLFLVIGYLSIQPWASPRFPSDHIIHFTDTDRWKIVGVIDRNPTEKGDRPRFILRTETLEKDDIFFPVTGKIRVTVWGDSPELSAGDRISLVSRIRSIRNFNNPGGFDYRRHMAFKGIWGTAHVQGDKLVILERDSEKEVLFLIEDARSRISDLIDGAAEGDERGVLKALIIGDRDGIPQHLREAFNRAGVAHILAISGLHIGIVATVSFIFFKWTLSHFNLFLWNAWTRRGAAVLSLFPIFAYGLISGMSPSTQRALIMVTVFLMTFLFEEECNPINTLALAAMLILAAYPPSLFSISFQLSFAAVLSIIYGLSRTCGNNEWIKKDESFHIRIRERLFLFFLVSLFAILGTLPIVALYFNRVSFMGLLANFFIIPLIGFIAVPLGLLSVFLYPLSIYVASVFISASAAVLSLAIDIILFFAGLPFASVKTVTPTYFEICLYYILGWAVLNLKSALPVTNSFLHDKKAHNKTKNVGRRLWRRAAPRQKVAACAILIVVLAGGVNSCYWLHYRFWHNDLRITIIDVGQGSSALLELPEGYRILIDGGGFSDNSIFDIGKRVVAPFLLYERIKTVDTVILSHPSSDHLNGLLYIIEHFNVKRVLTNNDAADTMSYRKFMEIVEKNKIPLPWFKDIPRIHNINGVQLEILNPRNDFIDRREKERWRNFNNSSLVVRVEFGTKSFLFPADIEARGERELVAIAGDRLKSTVLIAPHHGSKTSSSALFLERVEPEILIISAGWKNRFRHPHPSILERYRERGYRILRTDSHGALKMLTDGQSLKIRPTVSP